MVREAEKENKESDISASTSHIDNDEENNNITDSENDENNSSDSDE